MWRSHVRLVGWYFLASLRNGLAHPNVGRHCCGSVKKTERKHVDNSKELTHIGLCAGYGGIELGLKQIVTNLRTVALCEIEAFACANLVAKMEAGLMDAAPIWTDLKTFPWSAFCDRVDVLTGGYPCQPFSSAGKRLGSEDERHLWPYITSGIRILKPRVCFFENVEGHISLGLSSVISDLEQLGYEATFGIFSAAECGASHQRKRVFILAVADAISAGLQRCLREQSDARGVQQQAGRSSDCIWPSRPGQPQHVWEPPRVVRQTQPSMGGDTNGPANRLDYAELYSASDNRTDELRLLGNGVVPATATKAFYTLLQELSIG